MRRVIDFNRLHKQEYQKPTMRVVELQQRAQILAGSEPKELSGSKGEGGSEDTWRDLE